MCDLHAILEWAFTAEYTQDGQNREFIVEAYGGETPTVDVMMNWEHCTLAEEQVKELAAYLAAWLEWREHVAPLVMPD